MKQYIIDTDKQPKIPYPDWKIEEHIKLGKIKINPEKIVLHLEQEQKKRFLDGNVLEGRLKEKKVLNANVLDYLLLRPHLIPESWKGKAVFFWGTIYCDSDGNLCVRDLAWHGARWCSYYRWFKVDWSETNPAALLANNSLPLEKRRR